MFEIVGMHVLKMYKLLDSQLGKHSTLQKRFHNFLLCLKYFCNKQGVWGSIGENDGSSKNAKNSIAVYPET